MAKPSFILSLLQAYWFFALLCVSFSAGQIDKHQSLHPVDPSYAPRRRLAQTEPVHNISLYYAESGYLNTAHYAAIISWYMRYPSVVASDHPEISSVNCDVNGIHLEFSSSTFKAKALQWVFPLVVVLDGDTGRCAFDGTDQERYHPFYVESPSQGSKQQPTTMSLSGFRSRWDVVAYEHQVQVVQVKDGKPTSSRRLTRRELQDPASLDIVSSLNFDRQKNSSLKSEISLNFAGLNNGLLDMKCKDCFLDSEFQLNIYSASRIIDAGIKSINKVMKNLYRAEQQLIGSAQPAKLSQFSTLSEQLVDVISGFYNRVNNLALSTNQTEKIQLKNELGIAASSAKGIGSQLIRLAEGQLVSSFTSARMSAQVARLAVQELKEIAASTGSELEFMIQSGTQLVMKELSLPLCTISQEKDYLHSGTFCRKWRKNTSTRLSGSFKANFDVELKLNGTGEVTNGDVTVFSVNLMGLQIPGILSVGPQARLNSHTGLVFSGSAHLRFGAEAEWQNIDTIIDSHNQTLTELNHTDFVFHHHRPQFEIAPQQLSLEQHFKPQVVFGITLLLGAQELVAGIGADVGLINSLQIPATISKAQPRCLNGLLYSFSVTSQLEAITSVPSIPGLSLLKYFSSAATALAQGSYPLFVAPQLTLVKHCFKLPAHFFSSFDRHLNKFTNPGSSLTLSSANI
ncbi:hypothetical protein PCANC_13463 [Puccinia coronata f. sp. avenae]|uniref:DUF7223 domain-containing protein n=1 Tax=Puccinia coronata f. sp. avenae TaxID=200324 RepID=A0A2N5SRF0_9BASI|nr:hypothetical protein PCANC_13463 [Puccinia coronata f. sp. avenae]